MISRGRGWQRKTEELCEALGTPAQLHNCLSYTSRREAKETRRRGQPQAR